MPQWYSRVPEEEKADETEGDRPVGQGYHTASTRRKLPSALLLLEHATLFCLALFFLYTTFGNHRHSHVPSKLLASELPFAEHIVEYEDITFDPSGFWEDESMSTPWEGPVNNETEAAWERIVSVGMLSISEEELASTGLTTHRVYGEPGRYIVTIEMFHQLHCLHYLKQSLYGVAPKELTPHGDKAHLDHCVDYLRQVLMCHGDLTPITLGWSEEVDFYAPNFRIKHTCRNFDKIWDWAKTYNTSGVAIE